MKTKTRNWQDDVDNIYGLMNSMQFNFHSAIDNLILRSLVYYIRPIPKEERDNEKLVMYSESFYIFKRLENAYKNEELELEVEKLLLEYERYELLSKF